MRGTIQFLSRHFCRGVEYENYMSGHEIPEMNEETAKDI